ncbi:Protein CBG17369 [Caenorhabditis briggsae]|uniref:Protein CBG17369 n=2 Tax=Caenorhabditis briggsae TaxID=6238 RepID=A8XQX2_CAEBR|nr:Protein CBG17369 [Caenorhabditis briggsae]CAP35047.2 Protein CBG17369 [Caenorhabditis briggsae]
MKKTAKQNMFGFLKRLIPKDAKKEEKRRLLNSVDLSDVCVINVETLRCAVCFNIYTGVPRTLTCGHSFCQQCIEGVIQEERDDVPNPNGRLSLHCPICRKKVQYHKIVLNYTLKNILDSINELSQEEEEVRRAYDNTLDASNEQLRQRCTDLERLNNDLNKKIGEMRHKEYYNYVAIAFFIIIYIIMNTLLGN